MTREQQLLSLGFTLDYSSYYLYKYGNQYWMDVENIKEYTNEDWGYYIEDVKNDIKLSKKDVEDSENYLLGFSARKEIEQKILTDTLNKYRSKLSEEQIPKLGRTANYEKEVSYKAYIEIIEEIQNKLK